MKDVSVYLKHIQDAIARIESYTGQGRKAFFDNTMVQDAVIRNLEVIGKKVGRGSCISDTAKRAVTRAGPRTGGRPCKYAVLAVMRSALTKVASVDQAVGATGPAGSPLSRRNPPRGARRRIIWLSWCPGNQVGFTCTSRLAKFPLTAPLPAAVYSLRPGVGGPRADLATRPGPGGPKSKFLPGS